jgi:hypothetical protein
MAAAPAAAPTRTPKPTTATAAPIHFRTRFVDVQPPAAQLAAIESGDGLLGLIVVRHLHKRKTPRSARIPVRHDTDAFHCPVDIKKSPYLFFTGAKSQIAYKNLFHVVSSGS